MNTLELNDKSMTSICSYYPYKFVSDQRAFMTLQSSILLKQSCETQASAMERDISKF